MLLLLTVDAGEDVFEVGLCVLALLLEVLSAGGASVGSSRGSRVHTIREEGGGVSMMTCTDEGW